jgi:hypothetical protein
MKMLSVAIVSVMAVIGIILIIQKYRSGPSSRARTLEEKLAVLAECSLKLCEPFTVEDLLTSWDREEFEESGYSMTLVGLGMTEEQPPWRNHCINLWHFDTECIEDHGAYCTIANRMVEMAQGSLPLTNIQDHVDIENKQIWLSFSFRDETIKINCEVKDDWVDPLIFGHFVKLLGQSDPSKLYIYYDLGGQDCIIGCVTKEELRKLNANGIKFEPLN